MKVLVTGGAGYIGSHTARALARHGHQVVIYDNLCTGHRFLARGFDLVVGDIGDPAAVAAVLRDVDAVMHFAGLISVGESVQEPRKYFEYNVRSGLCLLNAVKDAGIPYFVFSSSAAVYGIPAANPIPEELPRQPVNPYGITKLLFENALESYHAAYGLGYVTLRYFNAAGADESGEVGEMHLPETHLIPLALMAAAGTRKELQIFGADYPTPDGTCLRDYIHVNDLAEAHVLALEYLANGGRPTAFNLGNGMGYSVLEIVAAVEQVTGLKAPRMICDRRAGDPPVLVADSAKARHTLGWNPSHSLVDIVATAWRWMQTNPQMRRSSVSQMV